MTMVRRSVKEVSAEADGDGRSVGVATGPWPDPGDTVVQSSVTEGTHWR